MRNREQWVIDASVALKWYLRDEKLLQQADAVRNAIQAESVLGISPHVSRYEVANGLSVAFRMGRIPAGKVQPSLNNFFDTRLARDHDPDWLLQEAARIAMAFPVFLNDGVYMALAQSLSLDFFTADRTLYDIVADRFPFVRWLGDVPVP